MKKAVVAMLLTTALCFGTAAAQSNTGTTIAQFLGIEPSACNAGMGNAGTAYDEGIESVYFNPGVIGVLSDPAIELSHSAWFADIDFNYVAAAVPIRGWGTFFTSVTALNSGDIDVRTVDSPLGTGERYTVANTAVGLGYGRQITSRFAAGLTINYINERIWHTTQNTMTLSAGTVYNLSEGGVKLGFSLSNLGTRSRFTGRDLAIQYDEDPEETGDNSALPGEQFTEEFQVPLMFRVGLSFPYQIGENDRLLFLIDMLHPNDNTESINAGAEWTWSEVLALRGGYQTLFQEDSELGLTFGAGFRGKLGENRFKFDYAWADHDHLGQTHRMTLILAF